jgi:hypothetical protein
MEKELFVERLRKLAPSKEDLLKSFKISDDSVKRFTEGYYCYAKSERGINLFSNNSLLSLLQHYDCSKVEIGVVNFIEEVVEEVDYYEIGNIEQDILSLNKITQEVEVLDYLQTSHVIWKCAANGDKFLDALLVAAIFFTSRLKDPSLMQNNSYAFEQVNLCTQNAGGDIYTDFYKMLLGYDD